MNNITNKILNPYKIELKDDEYVGEDGFYYCKKCNTRRTTSGWEDRKVRCICQCQDDEYKAREEQMWLEKKAAHVEKLKEQSLLGARYKNATFDIAELGYNESFDLAHKRCKKYCEVYEQVLEKGLGIYLYGDKGTGKTFLTACMVNELTNKYQTCLLTNFFDISLKIRSTFNGKGNETEFLKKLAEIEFLFIDDIGTEQVKRGEEDNWLQEKIFEILNARYNNMKPTIFTSNHSLGDLIKSRGFMSKTVDRIFEMTKGAVIEMVGESYRLRKQTRSIF